MIYKLCGVWWDNDKLMSIKDNIKEELLNIINEEEVRLSQRIQLNIVAYNDNYDASCESCFLGKLKRFVESI